MPVAPPLDAAAGGDFESKVDGVYVAVRDHLDELRAELEARDEQIVDIVERLVFVRGTRGPAVWAQNTWFDPQIVPVESISDAARKLRSVQRNWHLHSVAQHRRAALIQDRLPPVRIRPLAFPMDPPAAPLGAWALLDRERLVASAVCSSPFPDGEVTFIENRDEPPNRAYLKLWEALTLARRRPGPGERCLELGAAPGGWTWVLASLGAQVLSIDRASLGPELAGHPCIEHRQGDAFKLLPADVGRCDWVFCDLAAYPERIHELAAQWAEARPEAAMIFTVKLQGAPRPSVYRAFFNIPGSRLMHLSYNKHELTWFRLPGGGPAEAAAC